VPGVNWSTCTARGGWTRRGRALTARIEPSEIHLEEHGESPRHPGYEKTYVVETAPRSLGSASPGCSTALAE
jgi:hypothetical protein